MIAFSALLLEFRCTEIILCRSYRKSIKPHKNMDLQVKYIYNYMYYICIIPRYIYGLSTWFAPRLFATLCEAKLAKLELNSAAWLRPVREFCAVGGSMPCRTEIRQPSFGADAVCRLTRGT